MRNVKSVRSNDNDGQNYWVELEKRFQNLDVREQYGIAKAKLGHHPPKSYFEEWLKRAASDVLPAPPEEWAHVEEKPPVWTPPAKEVVEAYCRAQGWSGKFARHAWSGFIASNWRHYGERIASDAQWQAILDVMEWNP